MTKRLQLSGFIKTNVVSIKCRRPAEQLVLGICILLQPLYNSMVSMFDYISLRKFRSYCQVKRWIYHKSIRLDLKNVFLFFKVSHICSASKTVLMSLYLVILMWLLINNTIFFDFDPDYSTPGMAVSGYACVLGSILIITD